MAKLPSLLCAVFVAMLFAARAGAADRAVPYWAALRVDEVNMRVGPGEDYRISWVYRRMQLPLRVILEIMSAVKLLVGSIWQILTERSSFRLVPNSSKIELSLMVAEC